MAKTRSLAGDDLKVRPRTETASIQRGGRASDDFVPMQFRMPKDFARAFHVEAANHGLKLNELFARCFQAWKAQQ